MVLIDRLRSRAEAGVSNPAEVTSERLDTALVEATELIEDHIVSDTVKLDIAYFRLMLMIKKDGIDEIELEMYNNAMKIVSNTSTTNDLGEVVLNKTVKVQQRKNKWR